MDASKTPFDDPDFPGKSESAAGEPSSATGIFGTVSRPARPQEDDLLRSLLTKRDRTGEPGLHPEASGNTFTRCPDAGVVHCSSG